MDDADVSGIPKLTERDLMIGLALANDLVIAQVDGDDDTYESRLVSTMIMHGPFMPMLVIQALASAVGSSAITLESMVEMIHELTDTTAPEENTATNIVATIFSHLGENAAFYKQGFDEIERMISGDAGDGDTSQ